MADPARKLKDLHPENEFFVGIDSDGCVFDSMEIKHKECFIPQTVKHWGLQAVSRFAREAAEFVNLYSRYRGINRWPAASNASFAMLEMPTMVTSVPARRMTPLPMGMV